MSATGPIQSFEFLHSTRRLIYGPGAVDRLAEVGTGAQRAFVVLDSYFAESPLREKLETLLAASTPSVHVIAPHEPTTTSVEAARRGLVDASADLVVAVGGGSAIDTAKAARMHSANEGPFDALVGAQGRPMKAPASLFVAIPTTAGTGSEVSDSAIVDVPGTTYKAILRSPHMAPQTAILDPELTVSAPHSVTVSSGFDALTHAVEAYTSRMASPMTDPFALSGATLLVHNLGRLVDAPDDLAARGACLLGSAQAGIAFNSAHLGISHSIAGALGALHHVPHGVANALALPWTMAFNQSTIGDKNDILARLFDTADVASGISKLRHRMGLDRSLDEFMTGAPSLDEVAEAAMTSGQVKVNPRETTLTDMRAILEAMRQPTGGAPPVLTL